MQDDLMFFEFAYNERRYKDALKLARKLVDTKGSFIWHLKSCQLLFELGYIEQAGKLSKKIRLEFPYDIARNDLLQLDLIRLYYFWSIGNFKGINERIEPVHHYAQAVDDRNSQNKWIKAVYHNLQGNLLAERENFDKAVKAFEKSLKYKVKLKNAGFVAVTLNDLGLVHIKQGTLMDAITTLSEAMKKVKKLDGFDPLERRIAGNLGIAHRFFNNISQAEHFLKKARDASPGEKDIHYFSYSYHLLKIYQENHRFDEALKIYNQIYEAKDTISGPEAITLYLEVIYFQLYNNKLGDTS